MPPFDKNNSHAATLPAAAATHKRKRGKAIGRQAKRGARDTAPWEALAAAIERDMAAGKYADAGRLPTEAVMARDLGVNRHTLRRAIGLLVSKGLLLSVPRQGTFIAPHRLSFPLDGHSRFSDGLLPSGLAPGARLLSQRRCLPPSNIARRLSIARRAEVIELNIVRTGNGNPLCHITIWLPAERFARVGDLFLAAGELRLALAKLGVPSYRRSVARICSRRAENGERSALDLSAAAYLLVIETISVDPAGEPTHVSMLRFPADRVELTMAT